MFIRGQVFLLLRFFRWRLFSEMLLRTFDALVDFFLAEEGAGQKSFDFGVGRVGL